MKKLSNFYFDNNWSFEDVTLKLDADEWESLNNFLAAWFMVNRVDKLYIHFNSKQMTLNNQLQRLNAKDAQVMQKYITERLGVDGAFSFEFNSYSTEVICHCALEDIFLRAQNTTLENS